MSNFNPFSPNGIVHTNLFGGRSKYIIDILKKLSYVKKGRSVSFYLYGERGIGKTSLAKFIKYKSEARNKSTHKLNFLTSYYSVQREQDIKSVLEGSLNNITEKMPKNLIDRLRGRLGDLFKNGKFQIGAFGVNASLKNSENINITIKDQAVSIIRNIIQEIKKSDEKKANIDGLLIVIDEMDNLKDIDTVASVIRGINTTLDFEDLGYLSFLFIGYKVGLDKFISGDSSIARTIDQIKLEEMPIKEVIETFEKGFREAEVKWSKTNLKENANHTGGYPLAIQTIGYNLIDTDQDSNIDKHDWYETLQKSTKELIDKEYSQYYSFHPKEKKSKDRIMQLLATNNRVSDTNLSAKEIFEITGIKNPRQYLKKTIENGIVVVDGKSKYSVRKGMFGLSIMLDFLLYEGMLAIEKIEKKILNLKKKTEEKKLKNK